MTGTASCPNLKSYGDLSGDLRANTVALLRRLPEAAWVREGRHTESGRYTAEDWLAIYADHLEGHARQIETNVELWQAAQRR